MGTSKSYETPKNGDWKKVKNDINEMIKKNEIDNSKHVIKNILNIYQNAIINPTIAGNYGSKLGTSFNNSGNHNGSGNRKRHSGSSSKSSGKNKSSRTPSLKAARKGFRGSLFFGQMIVSKSIDKLAKVFDITDKLHLPAIEFIPILAEAINKSEMGLEEELAFKAIMEVILENVKDLNVEGKEMLENIKLTNGFEFAKEFLTKYIKLTITHKIEDTIVTKADSVKKIGSIHSKLDVCCETRIPQIIEDILNKQRISIDKLLKKDGQSITDKIVNKIYNAIIEDIEK